MEQSHPSQDQHPYTRPAEAGKHQFIALAWPGPTATYIDEVEDERAAATNTISAIADAVAKFEPVRLLVDEKYLDDAKKRFSGKSLHKIEVCTVATGCPDMWMRDLAPTFTKSSDGVLHGVDFNFNGWGGRTKIEASEKLAKSLLSDLNIPRVSSSITTEGGAIEVDGQGTLIASESSIINDNRNPGKSRAEIEAELSRTLGIQKFLWVPGGKNLDSTDFHIDAVARFVRPGVVLFGSPGEGPGDGSEEDGRWIEAHREARRILAAATDARGRKLEIIDVVEPKIEAVVSDKEMREQLSSLTRAGYRPVFSYANYLLVEGGVILSEFGDAEADAAALETVQKAFPDRQVVTVNATALGLFGGGIHCVSQEVPLV
ncbi:hypothetical protein PWT90_03538 [Aphanocladium album]|nr:hypothetical protein PWT90_03538 [Aphanocladium album]